MINKIALVMLGLFVLGGATIIITNDSENSVPVDTQQTQDISKQSYTSNNSSYEDDDEESDDEDDVVVPVKNTAPSTTVSAGTLKTYTMADVASHKDVASCWTAINGNIYDLTAFINKHPGGDRNILKICGIDGSRAFDGQHGGQSGPESILAGFEIGTLVK